MIILNIELATVVASLLVQRVFSSLIVRFIILVSTKKFIPQKKREMKKNCYTYIVSNALRGNLPFVNITTQRLSFSWIKRNIDDGLFISYPCMKCHLHIKVGELFFFFLFKREKDAGVREMQIVELFPNLFFLSHSPFFYFPTISKVEQ